MSLTYTVWSLDVWGNAEDGYDINDRCKVGSVELDESLESAGVLAALSEAGYVHAALCVVSDDSDEFNLYIESAHTSRPLLTLELEES